jgi:integrase
MKPGIVSRTGHYGCGPGRPLHRNRIGLRSGKRRKVARYEGCLQRVSRQVGEAHLGKAEHPRRSYHCRGTLASSTDVHRRPPDGSANEAKILSLMSALFNHAIRYEWLEQGRNPILFVRQSAKRQRMPKCLEPEELRALLSQLNRRFRVMVLLDAASGLRRSELLV